MKYLAILLSLVLISCDKKEESCEPWETLAKIGAKQVAIAGQCSDDKVLEVFSLGLQKVGLCNKNIQYSGINMGTLACSLVPSVVKSIEELGLGYLECKVPINAEELVKKALKCE